MAFDPSRVYIGELEVRGPFLDRRFVLEAIGPTKSGAALVSLTRWQAEALVEALQRKLAVRAV